MKILIINGPNLNLLGKREPSIYGASTLEQINSLIVKKFESQPVELDFFQSNVEGFIIDKLHDSDVSYQGVVINPGAYSHYSIAILDAIKSIHIPVIEVHLSNIYSREEFRRKSVTAEGCVGVISGLGHMGYILAVEALISYETT